MRCPDRKDAVSICERCGQSFAHPTWTTQRFCSHRCANARSNWKGRTPSLETREKMRIAKLGNGGPGHWNWKHGKRRDRVVPWLRDLVFIRDDYTCQACGARGVYLNAHHIKPYAKYPDIRKDPSNLTTLCVMCHRAVHRPTGMKVGDDLSLTT